VVTQVSPASAPAAAAAAAPTMCTDLCWLLGQVSHNLNTELTGALESVGISPRSYCVLTAALTGVHTQTELTRIVSLDKTTMVVTLDELEATGLAERRPAPGDRRARVIAVTAAGEEVVRRAEEIADQVREDVLAVLEEGDRQVFLDSLMQIATARLAEPAMCSAPPRRRL
jgi:MarR family transcriptional regulator for hemolysin